MENFSGFVNPSNEVQNGSFQSYIDLIRNCLIVVGVCGAAFSVSIIVVSHNLFTNISKTYNEINGYDFDTEEEEVPFEDKYLEEYNNLGDRDIDDSELIIFKNEYDTEETPRGIVKIAYDKEITTFIYYSNTKDLPYNYLEAIARGYVVQRDCKKILVDTSSIYIKAVELCKKEEEEKKERKEEEERKLQTDIVKKTKRVDVFASFKKYTKESLTKTEVKKAPLIEEANRYAYRGTLLDYEELFTSMSDPDDFEQLDYGTFKKLAVDNEKKNS